MIIFAYFFACYIIPSVFSQETCTPTPRDALGPFYRPDSPVTTDIASDLSDPSERLIINGQILGSNCLPVADATVEAWYAGGDPEMGEELYQDGDYRGQVVTDACGRYQFVQTFPSIYTGRPLHVHFRISNGDEVLVTQMYFEGFVEGRALQAVAIESDGSSGERNVNFDIVLQQEGTACVEDEVATPDETHDEGQPDQSDDETPTEEDTSPGDGSVEEEGGTAEEEREPETDPDSVKASTSSSSWCDSAIATSLSAVV